jgi:hypothetical protein
MAIKILSLGCGILPTSEEEPILDATLEGSPSMVVRNVRLVNTNTSEAEVSLYLNGPARANPPPDPSPGEVQVQLLRAGTKIPPRGLLIVDHEITLEAGSDRITAISTGPFVHYVISGFHRDS